MVRTCKDIAICLSIAVQQNLIFLFDCQDQGTQKLQKYLLTRMCATYLRWTPRLMDINVTYHII